MRLVHRIGNGLSKVQLREHWHTIANEARNLNHAGDVLEACLGEVFYNVEGFSPTDQWWDAPLLLDIKRNESHRAAARLMMVVGKYQRLQASDWAISSKSDVAAMWKDIDYSLSLLSTRRDNQQDVMKVRSLAGERRSHDRDHARALARMAKGKGKGKTGGKDKGKTGGKGKY